MSVSHMSKKIQHPGGSPPGQEPQVQRWARGPVPSVSAVLPAAGGLGIGRMARCSSSERLGRTCLPHSAGGAENTQLGAREGAFWGPRCSGVWAMRDSGPQEALGEGSCWEVSPIPLPRAAPLPLGVEGCGAWNKNQKSAPWKLTSRALRPEGSP